MFASTVLLSTCALSHNDDETSLINRLGQQGIPGVQQEDAVIDRFSSRRLGGDTVVAPEMGVEGGPCRDGWAYNWFGARCNWGLHCEKSYDGSAEFGICRFDGYHPHIVPAPAAGGANQRCSSGPAPCQPNLTPTDHGFGCVCESGVYVPGQAGVYVPGHQAGYQAGPVRSTATLGMAGDPFNQAQSQEEEARREQWARSVGSTQTLGMGGDPSLSLAQTVARPSTQALGMGAPSMGGDGDPCRNTPGDECNNGFHCHYSFDGTSTAGRCVQDSHQHQSTGGAGEQCNPVIPGALRVAPCNNGSLTPVYQNMLGGSGTACTCKLAAQPATGEEGEKCNRAIPGALYIACNHSNLRPRYRQEYPRGESCTCVWNFGN